MSKRLVIYDKTTGVPICSYPGSFEIGDLYGKERLDTIGGLCVDMPFVEVMNYRVINGELISMSDTKTEEEKILQALNPSRDEVQKAESVIKTLILLQEVL